MKRKPYGIDPPHTYASCKICSSPVRNQLERDLLNGKSHLSVSQEYNFHRATIRKHYDEHLLPFLQDVQVETRKALATQLADLSQEVYLPLMEKVKLGQDFALTTYKQALASANSGKSFANAIRALGEFRYWVQEEARMTGEYQKERQNQHDIRASRLRKAIEQRAKETGVTYVEELRYYLNSEFAKEVLPEVRRELLADLAEKEQEQKVLIERGRVIDLGMEAVGDHPTEDSAVHKNGQDIAPAEGEEE